MADLNNGVYNLNDELKKEKAQKDAGTSAAYANQLYGADTSAAAVGASGNAADTDYGAYLANQNATLRKKNINNGFTTSNQQAAAENTNTAATQATPQTTAQPATPTTAQPATQTPTDYSSLTEREQGLPDEAKNGIVSLKQQWQEANAKGNKAAMQNAYVEAQLLRARYGGFIDDIGDGTGAREFGYNTLSAADRDLPQEAQDELLRYKLLYQLATDDKDRKYYNSKAEQIRQGYGYTAGVDGSQYKENDLLTTPYKDNSTFTDPYAEQINSITDYLNNGTYDPSADPAYQAYENYYTRNANAAAQQALATAAGNTGGLASSYAQQLSAAAAQNYMKQLSDVIPTLQQNQVAQRQSLLNSLGQLQNNAYSQYSNNRDYNQQQWLQNWTNAYNLNRDANEIGQTNLAREDEQAWQELQNQYDREQELKLAGLS